jgi:hypothetical protein
MRNWQCCSKAQTNPMEALKMNKEVDPSQFSKTRIIARITEHIIESRIIHLQGPDEPFSHIILFSDIEINKPHNYYTQGELINYNKKCFFIK